MGLQSQSDDLFDEDNEGTKDLGKAINADTEKPADEEDTANKDHEAYSSAVEEKERAEGGNKHSAE